MNMGDRIQTNDSNPALPRGLFGYGSRVTQAHVLDGMSFTIMVAERANGVDSSDIRGLAANNVAGMHLNPSTCLALASGGRYLPGVSVLQSRTLGSLWNNGHASFSGFNTVLPPNSPTCLSDNWDQGSGLVSASSYHLGGGMNVLMADGAVRSIDQTIDCGNSSQREVTTGPSPYGLWGALGTMRGGEGQGDTW
jgi:prepilin-type processing-associated H-X9-DG protein